MGLGVKGAAPFIFIVAGEPSGDALGAGLIAALRERTGGNLRIAGVGGERMREEGLASLVPLDELAVIGVAEVLPRAICDPAPGTRNGRRDPRAAARRGGDDRQLRVQLADCAAAAPSRRDPAAGPLRGADGLGVARRPGAAGGALVRPS